MYQNMERASSTECGLYYRMLCIDHRGVASAVKGPCDLCLLGFKHLKAIVTWGTSHIWGNSHLMTGILRLDRVTPKGEKQKQYCHNV
jgi:hypothetical protein